MRRVIICVAAALLLASTASAAGPMTGKVVGTFFRGYPVDSGNLKRYIKTSKVWCAWQNGKVLVHVQMRNTSAEHVTVNWYPSYTIRRGGWHGKGFTAAQSNGSSTRASCGSSSRSRTQRARRTTHRSVRAGRRSS